MPFDPNKFAEELLKDAKIDDATRKALLTSFGDPVVSKKLADLNDGYMRQSDYSRKQAEAQEALKKSQDWYEQLNVWHANKQAEFTKLTETAGVTHSEDPDNNGTGLSKKDVEAMLTTTLAAREKDELALVAAMQNLAFDHYKQFGEPLDTNVLIKKATDDRTNVNIAYERLIQPKMAEKAAAALDVRIKQERADAVKEALANANIPSSGAISSLAGSYVHPLDGVGNPNSAAGVPKFGWKAAAQAHTASIVSGNRITSDDGF